MFKARMEHPPEASKWMSEGVQTLNNTLKLHSIVAKLKKSISRNPKFFEEDFFLCVCMTAAASPQPQCDLRKAVTEKSHSRMRTSLA